MRVGTFMLKVFEAREILETTTVLLEFFAISIISLNYT